MEVIHLCVQDWQDRRKSESDILMKRETDRAWVGVVDGDHPPVCAGLARQTKNVSDILMKRESDRAWVGVGMEVIHLCVCRIGKTDEKMRVTS